MHNSADRGPEFKRREWVRDWSDPVVRVRQSLQSRLGLPHIYSFADLAARNRPVREDGPAYPCVVHAWDNTPRSGRKGVVYVNPDPELFRGLLHAAADAVADKPPDERLVFLKSWSEWAEGNHLEPDLRYGTAYLEVVRDVLRDVAAGQGA